VISNRLYCDDINVFGSFYFSLRAHKMMFSLSMLLSTLILSKTWSIHRHVIFYSYHLAGHPPTLEPIRSTMKAVNRHGRRAGSVATTLRRQD